MIPPAHRQESFHRAVVHLIAAQAGIQVTRCVEREYGLDGQFRMLTERQTAVGRRLLSEFGYPLDFQLKATTGCRDLVHSPDQISFDCKADAHNKIVLQNEEGAVPVLLLVLCLPADAADWLQVTSNGVTLPMTCYWYYLHGPQTVRDKTIRVPRSQLFTPQSLTDIMERLQRKKGRWS